MGNLGSVVNAFEYLGAKVKVSGNWREIEKSSGVVIPGQGAFRDCILNLNKSKLSQHLTESVIKKKKPYLGICLGLQVLAEKSYEMGRHKGLGWIKGEVKKIKPRSKSLKIPHLGWNDVTVAKPDSLFAGLSQKPCFYFAHSYHFVPKSNSSITLTCNYGQKLVVGVKQDNISAVQFHPEKSHREGLQLISNFIKQVN